MSKREEVVLILSDLHAPAMHRDAVDFLDKINKVYRPQSVKCTGDEINWESMSYHEHDPDLPSGGDELTLARKQLRPVMQLFPDMDLMESNHGDLPKRKAKTAGMPSAIIRSYGEILDAPKGWRWHHSHTFKTALGPVIMTHGKTSAVDKLSKSMAMSAIQGHYHSKAYISYWASPVGLFFDMNVGCLADDKHLAMAYGKNSVNKGIVGVGLLINGVPRLQPLVMDRRSRWIGRL